MPEKRVFWEKPTTPLPGETPPVKGAVGACRDMVREGNLPRDGEWYRCKWPFSGTSSNANQARRQLSLEYPAFEFRVKAQGGLRYMWIRFRKDDQL